MRLIEYTEVSWAALVGNPMRSALTTLGIVIGVAAVVGVSLILNGMAAAMSKSFEGLGPRALFIMPYQGPESRNQRVELTYEDALAVQAECPAVEFTAPQITLNTTVTAEGRSRLVALIATIPPYQDFNNTYVEEGRFFNAVDLRHRRNVCVVGGTVADEIGRHGLIGRSLRIDRHYFEVIGVMERQGQMMGTDRDDVTLIPLSTAGKLYGTTLPRHLTVMTQARSPALINSAMQQITTVLRKRHRLDDRPADFKVYTQTEILSSFRQFSMLVTVYLSLILSAVGIFTSILFPRAIPRHASVSGSGPPVVSIACALIALVLAELPAGLILYVGYAHMHEVWMTFTGLLVLTGLTLAGYCRMITLGAHVLLHRREMLFTVFTSGEGRT